MTPAAGQSPEAPRPPARVDERDTMFARMAREPGTASYEDYYGRRPELKGIDDRLRLLPRLLAPGGRFFDAEIAGQAAEWFARIDEITIDNALVDRWRRRLETARDPTAVIRELLLENGAVAAGAAPLDRRHVYTYKGRFAEDYGRKIELDHPSVVVFLFEMDFAEMRRAPKAEAIRESARQYYRAAVAARLLEAVLEAAGYHARAHYDAHYDLILPPLAVNAGLGELGRNNILIADRYGSRVRIGAVSTDFPLEHGRPRSLGAAQFCEICMKCADNCPSRSLSRGKRELVRGVPKWPTTVETCYAYWRSVGTDCGVCMACCPFSHRNSRFHNFVRWLIRRWRRTHRPARFLDDLIYGRRWQS